MSVTGVGLVCGRVCKTSWIYLVSGRMFLTGVKINRWQSVENKLDISGEWVNVSDWG